MPTAVEKEVVQCSQGRVCGAGSYGPDHHGWDCPLSDPVGDVLRAYGGRLANPILEEARLKMVRPILERELGPDPE